MRNRIAVMISCWSSAWSAFVPSPDMLRPSWRTWRQRVSIMWRCSCCFVVSVKRLLFSAASASSASSSIALRRRAGFFEVSSWKMCSRRFQYSSRSICSRRTCSRSWRSASSSRCARACSFSLVALSWLLCCQAENAKPQPAIVAHRAIASLDGQ